jgi:hypothetical protein
VFSLKAMYSLFIAFSNLLVVFILNFLAIFFF